ncbi:MAG TPA: DUF885 domain-containing protein [Candidatus Limnocylindrales bacterium]|nr:DUF885 domain-containing protein [Candidatus Limnocylindrales bacterium]
MTTDLTPSTGTAAAELRALADTFWEHFLVAHPTFATVLGDRRWDDRVEDLSPAARDAEIEDLAATLRAVELIDPGALDGRDRVTRSMLIEELSGRLGALRSRVDEWSLNPIDGPQIWLVDLVDYQPVTTPLDGRNMIARWRAIGPHLDEAVEGLRRGMARGQVASVVPVERVIDEVRGLLAAAPEAWRLAGPAAEPHDDWPDGELAAFREGLVAAVREAVVPAFGRYLEVLESEILPAARPSDRPGLCHVPDGEAAYRVLIRTHTTLDAAPERIHEIGLAEIERIDAAFADLGAKVLRVHGLEATLGTLRAEPALRFGTADQVFSTARDTLARAEAAIPAWFGRLPRSACEVLPMPPEAEAHQTLAYYAWPALDGSRPGRFYVNLHAPETRPRFEAEALAFHESVPGHHLQLSLAQELDGLPAFQRALGSDAFAEGWALYAERLADEMGLYTSDLDRFGILSFDAWRASRLVVDTGIHALGWTRDEAIDFMRAHTALGDNNIANEVDRYIAWPAQALAYKLGQLEIVRLRRLAESRLGARFDIRDFHDVVLGSGAVGLTTLAGIVDDGLATDPAG